MWLNVPIPKKSRHPAIISPLLMRHPTLIIIPLLKADVNLLDCYAIKYMHSLSAAFIVTISTLNPLIFLHVLFFYRPPSIFTFN